MCETWNVTRLTNFTWFHVGVTLLLARHHTHSGRRNMAGVGWRAECSKELFKFFPLSRVRWSEEWEALRKKRKKKKQMPVLCWHAELGFNLVKLLGPRLRPFSTHVTTISSQALRRGKKGGRNPLLSLSNSDEDASSSCMATSASLANGYDAFDPILRSWQDDGVEEDMSVHALLLHHRAKEKMEIWDERLSVFRSRFALGAQSPGSVRKPCPAANRIHILACRLRKTRPEKKFFFFCGLTLRDYGGLSGNVEICKMN